MLNRSINIFVYIYTNINFIFLKRLQGRISIKEDLKDQIVQHKVNDNLKDLFLFFNIIRMFNS